MGTHPGRGDRYVYAEWSVGGRHHCKSCGNANNLDSRRRALAVLRGAALDRMAALQSEIDRLRAALELGEGRPDG